MGALGKAQPPPIIEPGETLKRKEHLSHRCKHNFTFGCKYTIYMESDKNNWVWIY